MTKETKTEKYLALANEFYKQTEANKLDPNAPVDWHLKSKMHDLIIEMSKDDRFKATRMRKDLSADDQQHLYEEVVGITVVSEKDGEKQVEYDKEMEEWIEELVEKNDLTNARVPKEKFLGLTKLKNTYRETHEDAIGRKYIKKVAPFFESNIKDEKFQKLFQDFFSWSQRQLNAYGMTSQTDPTKWSPKHTYEYACEFICKYYDIHTIRGDKLEMWITIDDIERPNAENYIKEMCRLLYGARYNKAISQQVIEKIAVDTLIDEKEYFQEADPRYVAVKNGILDIYENMMKPKPKGLRFFSRINTNYNEDAKCPQFEEHLNQVLIDQSDKKAIQEFFGFSLVRHHKIEKAFVWLGGGRNGKGKTAEALIKMIGQENNVNIPMSHIETYPFAMAGLFGKHLNCIAEFEQDQIKSTAKFKNLTGNDEVTAPRKHISELTFKSYAKWLILANELPNVKDLTVAFFNRISIIQFPFTFMAKPDFDLLSKEEVKERGIKVADPSKVDKITTQEELEGILLWSIKGLNRLMENKGFTTSKSDKDNMRIWKQSSNNFSTFAEEFLTNDWGEYISKREMKYVYHIYCKRYGLKPVTDRKTTFYLSNDMGLQVTQKWNATGGGSKLYVWDGIKFNSNIRELLDWGKDNGFEEPIQVNTTREDDLHSLLEDINNGDK